MSQINNVIGLEVRRRLQDIEDIKHLSSEAQKRSLSAEEMARLAELMSKSTKEELDQIVIEGDSSVEAAQARVDAKGEPHNTLKARLDYEYEQINIQLSDIIGDIGNIPLFKAAGDDIIEKLVNEFTDRSVNIKWWQTLVVDDDWTDAIEAAIEFMDNQPWEGFKVLFFPPGQYRITRPIYLLNSRFMIVGANRHLTIIKANKESFIQVGNAENKVNRFNFTNIRIQATNVNDSGEHGLILDHASEGDFNEVSIDSFNNGSGIEFRDNCWTLNFDNVRLNGSKLGVLITGNEVNAVTFAGGMINLNEIGVYIDCDRETNKVHNLRLIDGIQMEGNEETAIKINSGRIWGMVVDGYFEINHANNESRLLIARRDDPGTGSSEKRFTVYNFTLKTSYIWHRDTQKTPFLVDTRNGDSVFRGTVESTTFRNAKLDYGLVRCIGSSSIVLVKDCLLIREDGQVSYSTVFNEQGGGAKVLETLNSSQTMFRTTGDVRLRGGNLQLEQGSKLLADGGIGVNNHQRISDAKTGWIYGKFPLYDFDGNFLGNVITYRDND